MTAFQVAVPGKFIVTGEHAVLRGVPAVVFPLSTRNLSLTYENKDQFLEVITPDHQQDLKRAAYLVLERAQMMVSHPSNLRGLLHVKSDIPVGSGLGASAALTVAVAKMCHSFGWIQESDLQDFARELENLFHGESSGVDVASVLSQSPLMYIRGSLTKPFEPIWKPKFVLKPSSHKGLTSDCIQKVKSLWQSDWPTARKIDDMMRESSRLAMKALTEDISLPTAQGLLSEALNMGAECFTRWNLMTPEMHATREELLKMGCIAVKPTGSGAGGYLLGLWPLDREPLHETGGIL